MRWRVLRAMLVVAALGGVVFTSSIAGAATQSLAVDGFIKPGIETYGDPDLGNGGGRLSWRTIIIYRLRQTAMALIRQQPTQAVAKPPTTTRSAYKR